MLFRRSNSRRARGVSQTLDRLSQNAGEKLEALRNPPVDLVLFAGGMSCKLSCARCLFCDRAMDRYWEEMKGDRRGGTRSSITAASRASANEWTKAHGRMHAGQRPHCSRGISGQSLANGKVSEEMVACSGLRMLQVKGGIRSA